MFGTLGWQETAVIFILALLLFGPKKLPELGRTIGKALTEFRRASSELKSTFDREMKNLELETADIKQAAAEYHYDTYNYGDSSTAPYDQPSGTAYDQPSGTPYDHSYGTGESDFAASHPSIASASATLGAESTSSVSPEGTVVHGVNTEAANGTSGQPASTPEPAGSPEHPVPTSTTTEFQA